MHSESIQNMTISHPFSPFSVQTYTGYALNHAINKMNIGSQSAGNYLQRLLSSKGFNLDTVANKFDVIEDIIRTKCYITTDYQTELKLRNTNIWQNNNIMKYGLPDGNDITLDSNRFESCEVFFKPSLIGGHLSRNKSLVQYAYDSLLSCNIDVRPEITSNICIAGGGTLINGFVERFSRDLKNTVPMSMRLQINAKPNRENAAWIGASILSCLSFFKESVITSEEYEESGPKIVNRKCF